MDYVSKQTRNTKNEFKTASGSNRTGLSPRRSKSRSSHRTCRLSTAFVCIHPFEDGNGRLCRPLLNAMTIRYAVSVAEIGKDPREREEYLREAWLANTTFRDEEQRDIPWEEQTANVSLGRMVLEKVTSEMRETGD
ncbi:hypothetical protein VE02_00137 [Pseudogymnoascus sp. 03VT05]|nr:hypothetical protein VE02_00137 [Pseudogymnoascus sp. 03VT05]